MTMKFVLSAELWESVRSLILDLPDPRLNKISSLFFLIDADPSMSNLKRRGLPLIDSEIGASE